MNLARQSLSELQAAMMQALHGAPPAPALLANIRAAAHAPAAEAMSVYRHSMQSTLINALRLSYPTVEQLVGRPFFQAAAASFVRATPSRHGDLDCYGADFGAHLGQLSASADLPWLADLARLEWLLHQLHRTTSEPTLAPEDLAGADGAAIADRVLALTQRTVLFESQWPVVRIWLAHRESNEPDFDGVDARPDRALVIAAEPTQIRLLDEASWAFFKTLAQENTLLAAVDKALTFDPAFDFLSTFASALENGAFATGSR